MTSWFGRAFGATTGIVFGLLVAMVVLPLGCCCGGTLLTGVFGALGEHTP